MGLNVQPRSSTSCVSVRNLERDCKINNESVKIIQMGQWGEGIVLVWLKNLKILGRRPWQGGRKGCYGPYRSSCFIRLQNHILLINLCFFSQDLEDLNLDDAKPDKKSKKKAKKAVNSDSEEEVEVKKVQIIYFMKIQ